MEDEALEDTSIRQGTWQGLEKLRKLEIAHDGRGGLPRASIGARLE